MGNQETLKQILMLLTNPYRPDSRVKREATSLNKMGYQINIIAWDRENKYPETETFDYAHLLRVHDVHSIYYAGIKQALKLPLFWKQILQKASNKDFNYIHCHDLDTLYAGVQLKKQTKAKLIYDAHENYPQMMSLYLPKVFTYWLAKLEKELLKKVDLTITASNRLASYYHKLGIDRVCVIPNTAELRLFDKFKQDDSRYVRNELGLDRNQLIVGYIGGLNRNRLLEPLILAAKNDPSIMVCIWGDGINRRKIEKLCADSSNIKYYGWLEPENIPLYTHMLDIYYYAIEPNYPGSFYNAPNSLGYAMAASKPIIGNRVGDLGDIISREKCGILLDEVNSISVRQAIKQLEDRSTRSQLGSAGRKAAEDYFSWENTEKKLYSIYESLS